MAFDKRANLLLCERECVFDLIYKTVCHVLQSPEMKATIDIDNFTG